MRRAQGWKDAPRPFAVAEALVEALEPLAFVDHLGRAAATTASRDDFERIRDQPEHALRFNAAFEGPHRVRMDASFLGPLGRGALLKEHQRADEFITIWRRVVERQWGSVGIGTEPHWASLPAGPPGHEVPGHAGRVTPRAARPPGARRPRCRSAGWGDAYEVERGPLERGGRHAARAADLGGGGAQAGRAASAHSRHVSRT
jgi:hypothetical protein